MKRLFHPRRLALLLSCCLLMLSGCTQKAAKPADGAVLLYGEYHANPTILKKELALWQERYEAGWRDLFVELPYYTAQYLNRYMQEDDDTTLLQLYEDAAQTQLHSQEVLDFYRTIKASCPETVFHGTDLGHQYDTTGARYLALLRKEGQLDSAEYRKALACVESGKTYYHLANEKAREYRENAMTANFLQAYNALPEGSSILGFYGAAHTDLSPDDGFETMALRLQRQLGDRLSCTDLRQQVEALRTDDFEIGGKHYAAYYYGAQTIPSHAVYQSREFWLLADAYADFCTAEQNGDTLPCSNYPMPVKEEQVYLLRYTKKDGTQEWMCYRSEGTQAAGDLTTVGILLPD